jgi:DNA primase
VLDSLLPAAAQLNSLEKATAKYEQNVEALASYLGGRGIGQEAALGQRLGLASDPEPGHERFRGWMSIPYITPGGVVAMKFRRLDEGSPKYDSPAGQKIKLYNAGVLATTKSDVVLICEGELDAIVGTYTLGIPTVGTWGTNWLDHHPRCFADFEDVVVIADNDIKDDGSNPGLKHAKHVQSSVSRSRIVTPPPGCDLGEWVASAGREAVLERIGL